MHNLLSGRVRFSSLDYFAMQQLILMFVEVTIDEFFQKTETKPVLYYLPHTDEQIKQKKERQGQQPEGQPRRRRHRGGRKRNRRARFRKR